MSLKRLYFNMPCVFAVLSILFRFQCCPCSIGRVVVNRVVTVNMEMELLLRTGTRSFSVPNTIPSLLPHLSTTAAFRRSRRSSFYYNVLEVQSFGTTYHHSVVIYSFPPLYVHHIGALYQMSYHPSPCLARTQRNAFDTTITIVSPSRHSN